tara:strand:+ start:9248 stop:12046 length:2799 start_codon:yes stop_codon:yes gene_type:complete
MSLSRSPHSPQSRAGNLKLFTFTHEELALAQLAALSIGVRPGDKRGRDQDSEDGASTTISPTAEERAVGMIATAKDLIATAKDLIRRAEAPDPGLRETLAQRVASLLTDIHSLLRRRGDELEGEARRRLRRYVRRLEAAQRGLTGDTEMTQMPDDVLGGEGGQESADSEDSDEASASGFGGEGVADEDRDAQGGGFSPSQAADDIEQLSDLEEDADAAVPQPAAGPGDATQLEAMELDDGGATRLRRLRELRDDVVALLRDVPSGGPLPMELRKRALALRRLVAPFMGASEAARRMSGAVSELLKREVADGGGPSGTASSPGARAGGPQAEPGPDASGSPRGARIVGRATDVLVDGSHRHSFLLFQPPRSYSWLTEEGMRAKPALLAILNVYPGPKGDDPSGNGFVVVVVRARGPTGRRQYRVRWTVEPQVPVKYAEAHDDGWLLRRQLVNPGMADAFDRRQRDEDASGDEDDDMGAGGVEAESQDTGEGAGGPSALKWSPAQGRPLLSMRRAVAQHGGAHLGALWEYTASRLFALRCRVPPAPNMPGAPTEDELVQVGKDLYEVDRKALDAVFRRERAQEARDRLLSADEEEGDEEEALAAWRAEREAELRADAEARWSAVRVEDAPHTARLEAQLEAIEALEAAGGDAAAVPPATAELLSDAAVSIVAKWAADHNEAAASISQPRLRLPRIRDVLSQPSRSAVADGWLRLLRDVHSDTAPAERLASAYGPSWPQRPGPTATPPDHVVATRSLRMGAGLVIEHGDPSQNPTNLALCTLSQNSAKSDSVLGLFSAPGEVQGAAGQDVYSPGGVSDAKKAMLAKAVAMVFALYWGARCCHALLCTHPLACGALVRSAPLAPSSMHSAPPQESATRSVPPALPLTTRVAPALKCMRARGRAVPSRRLYDGPLHRLKGGMPFSQPPCRSGALATH